MANALADQYEELWSTECTVDQLTLELARSKGEITIDQGYYVDGQRSVKKLAVRKYYLQALKLMKWIPITNPVPVFVINITDLSPKTIKELEARIDNPKEFEYILKQAVGRIFENLDFDRYHISIARRLKVRPEW